MLYCVWFGSLWADLVRTKCGICSACMLNHVLNLFFSQASFTVFFILISYSLPNSLITCGHCAALLERGRGGWPEGCQSRHIRINPMFDCVIFVNVCDFAKIKSIQKSVPEGSNLSSLLFLIYVNDIQTPSHHQTNKSICR